MILTLNNFETAVGQLNNAMLAKWNPPAIIDHFVLNVHRDCLDTVANIQSSIKAAKPTQLLYGMDLRVIPHSQGNPENWSLEMCSNTKSLARMGVSPTA